MRISKIMIVVIKSGISNIIDICAQTTNTGTAFIHSSIGEVSALTQYYPQYP